MSIDAAPDPKEKQCSYQVRWASGRRARRFLTTASSRRVITGPTVSTAEWSASHAGASSAIGTAHPRRCPSHDRSDQRRRGSSVSAPPARRQGAKAAVDYENELPRTGSRPQINLYHLREPVDTGRWPEPAPTTCAARVVAVVEPFTGQGQTECAEPSSGASPTSRSAGVDRELTSPGAFAIEELPAYWVPRR